MVVVWCGKLCFFFPSRIEQSTVTGVASVCETPEKKPNPSTGQHRARARAHAAQKTDARVVVENTMRSSCSDVQNTDSQRKKAEPKPSGDYIMSSTSAFVSSSRRMYFSVGSITVASYVIVL